ncbi:serine hydrolase [Nocardiopsis aegyptia]|uniref:Dipeptidyl aminopeptidase/acylaminoacyl peptidase n=1 Tax=Nocardiopsis aegyptia TaxID=220378 RepID=A0A7Z0EMR8_9ACTN|nr:serine hydrolase [Nocardiopsis aegyptia]NYJ35003.1 dipeptidyl aminopeptidase/acylaminoacyl peptidase [Nocardiopsis aegyptia]
MTRPLRIDDLYSLALPEQPSLSPDSTRVAYVLRTAEREHDRDERTLWTVPTGSGGARRLTDGPVDTAPAWSPDGDRIAFLRGGNGPAQVCLLPADGGEPEPITELPLGAGTPVWSPDGTAIAFTAPVDRQPSPRTEATAPPPVVVDTLDHRVDVGGLEGTVRSHLHVLDLPDRRVRQITDGDWHAGAPAWSPDSRSLAFCATPGPAADMMPSSAVYVVDVSAPGAGSQPQLVGGGTGIAQTATWTAEGDALLVVGRTDTEQGHVGLLRVPLDGSPTVDLVRGLGRDVTPGGPACPGAPPRATADARAVLFCVRDRGCSHLYTVDATGGAPRQLIGGVGRMVSGLSDAEDIVVVVLATPERFGEIVAVEPATGKERVLTRHGAALDEVEHFPAQEREFKVSDGGTVHGRLLRDPERTGPAPLLLDIHDGPHDAWNGAADPVHLYHQELIARGWTVLLLDPRGSDGCGDTFTLGAQGTGDAQDFLEPIDTLVAEGTADPDRLAVAGYGRGGRIAGYLASRDDRFTAAVAGAMFRDSTRVCGTSDAVHGSATAEAGVSPQLDRDRYVEPSPCSRAQNVRTPTLILHGAADERCPAGQAEQWFDALKVRGVPTRLVLYPGGSHRFLLDGPPSHRTDLARRIVDWVVHRAGESASVSSVKSAERTVDARYWQRRLADLAERHRVPGAVLGIARGAHSSVAAHGVLNKATGVTTTRDSLFQIGSITKVWTATLAMQLVDEGALDLDAPVADVLPELRLADPRVAQRVTMRHLLTHTSGIDGDVFTDTGRGDDCLERFVGQLDEAAQNHPMGATFSYCNSGFVLAGRVIEKLTGMSWDRALRERLCAPLGLERTVTLPEEALRFRTAMGHDSEGGQPPRPVPAWGLPRSSGPAGLITATADDVLAFARLHLTGGTAPDGTRLLSERAAQAMTEQQVELPETHSLGDSWGLGWIRFGWDGRRLIGHDGSTLGQSAFLRVLPEQDLAVTLLTNGGAAKDLYRDLFGEIFAELAGMAIPEPPQPPTGPVSVDARRHLGRYERAGTRIDILEGTDGLRLRYTTTGPLARLVPEPVYETTLVPVSDSQYLVQYAGSPSWIPVTFYSLPTGESYVHHGMRATPKLP